MTHKTDEIIATWPRIAFDWHMKNHHFAPCSLFKIRHKFTQRIIVANINFQLIYVWKPKKKKIVYKIEMEPITIDMNMTLWHTAWRFIVSERNTHNAHMSAYLLNVKEPKKKYLK